VYCEFYRLPLSESPLPPPILNQLLAFSGSKQRSQGRKRSIVTRSVHQGLPPPNKRRTNRKERQFRRKETGPSLSTSPFEPFHSISYPRRNRPTQHSNQSPSSQTGPRTRRIRLQPLRQLRRLLPPPRPPPRLPLPHYSPANRSHLRRRLPLVSPINPVSSNPNHQPTIPTSTDSPTPAPSPTTTA
jgi:hypothetical protein